MAVQLNHLIVMASNQAETARFFTEILGLPGPTRFGPFLVVQTANGVSLDFDEFDGEFPRGHYAFLITEAEFDEIFARIRARGIDYWADPERAISVAVLNNGKPILYPEVHRFLGTMQRITSEMPKVPEDERHL